MDAAHEAHLQRILSEFNADARAKYEAGQLSEAPKCIAPWVRPVRIGATIEGLFGARGPSAILAAVAAVVVNTFERVPRRWSRPHIGKKERKAIAPVYAHFNSSAAVTVVVAVIGVVAALNHPVPDAAFWGGAGAWVVTVDGRSLARRVGPKAATTLRGAIPQGWTDHFGLAPAIAATEPQRPRTSVRRERSSDSPNHYQATKPFPL